MEPESIGLLLIGLGILGSALSKGYELFFKPREDTRLDLGRYEKEFMKELQMVRAEMNVNQQQLLNELSRLNTHATVQELRITNLEECSKEHKEAIAAVRTRVSQLERE